MCAIGRSRKGYACDVIAPSLIPKRSGVHRKHDKRDAAELARLHRGGGLVAVRIPSEADERVRVVVRCQETFQREILKSRHYILKFLAKRGFVFREGTNWCMPHLQWLQHLTTDGSPLAADDPASAIQSLVVSEAAPDCGRRRGARTRRLSLGDDARARTSRRGLSRWSWCGVWRRGSMCAHSRRR